MPADRKSLKEASARQRSVVVDDIARLVSPILPPSPEKKVGLYRGEQSIAKKHPFNKERVLGLGAPPSKRSSSASTSDPFQASSRPRTTSLPRSPSKASAQRKKRDPMDIIFNRSASASQLRLNEPPKPKALPQAGSSPQIIYMEMPQTDGMIKLEPEKESETGMPNIVRFGAREGCALAQPDAVSNDDPGVPKDSSPVVACFAFSGYGDLGLFKTEISLLPKRRGEDFLTMRVRIIQKIRAMYDEFYKMAQKAPEQERKFAETEDEYPCDAGIFSANDVRIHSLVRLRDDMYRVRFMIPRARARNILASPWNPN